MKYTYHDLRSFYKGDYFWIEPQQAVFYIKDIQFIRSSPRIFHFIKLIDNSILVTFKGSQIVMDGIITKLEPSDNRVLAVKLLYESGISKL